MWLTRLTRLLRYPIIEQNYLLLSPHSCPIIAILWLAGGGWLILWPVLHNIAGQVNGNWCDAFLVDNIALVNYDQLFILMVGPTYYGITLNSCRGWVGLLRQMQSNFSHISCNIEKWNEVQVSFSMLQISQISRLWQWPPHTSQIPIN